LLLVTGVFIVAAKRTPFGAYGGLLKDFTATDLAEFAAKAALSSGKVPPETVDSVVVGNVTQTSTYAIYLARHVGLRVGIPKETPALTVNRLCGSGFQSIVNGCQDICVKDSEVVLCGGTENMSQSPYCVRNVRFGTKICLIYFLCMFLSCFYSYGSLSVLSANDAGYFNNEMVPIEVKTRKGKQTMQVDEHARPETTLEQLQKLPPVFKKDGTVTAGNASGICDGAAAVIIASEDAVKKHNFTPLARIVGYHVSGCDPSIMGIGKCVVNEAFAPQYLAVEKSLGLDPSKTNVNGGAIALGHPLAGSGTRIIAHLVHELRYLKSKSYSFGSAEAY
uniref:Acetyl-CoA acyltransferase 2 n=1 Tax=Propithecus coquereli TaxID=379532 RepID=A0A2K6FXF7_PROCO